MLLRLQYISFIWRLLMCVYGENNISIINLSIFANGFMKNSTVLPPYEKRAYFHYDNAGKDINDVRFTVTGVHKSTPVETNVDSCEEGRAYGSLDSCVSDCERRLRGPSESIYKIDNAFTYKVMLLNSDELNVTTNKELRISATNIRLRNYSYVVYQDGTVRACLPLVKELSTCDVWTMLPSEVKFENNGQSLWVEMYKRRYHWNEFFLLGKNVIICIPEETRKLNPIALGELIGSLISAACLCVLWLFSSAISELRNNRLLQCHVIMLTMAFTVLSFRFVHHQTETNCVITSAIQHFFLLSAFFWINSQSYEIYYHFKNGNIQNTLFPRRFLYYSIFSWGLPLVIISIAVATQMFKISHLRPSYKTQCWFHFELDVAFFYLYGWMALSILINLVLFFIIGYGSWKSNEDKHHLISDKSQREIWLICIKLVTIKGAYWILKIITWVCSNRVGLGWYFDMVSQFQGLVVFLVYVCKIKTCCKEENNSE